MSSLVEKRLYWAAIAVTNTVGFTVPSGHRYVIKQIIIANTSSDATVSLGLNGTAATAANRFASAVPCPGSDTITLESAIVLEATDTFNTIANQVGCNIMVVGWDHTL